jgi:hypothetical protein
MLILLARCLAANSTVEAAASTTTFPSPIPASLTPHSASPSASAPSPSSTPSATLLEDDGYGYDHDYDDDYGDDYDFDYDWDDDEAFYEDDDQAPWGWDPKRPDPTLPSDAIAVEDSLSHAPQNVLLIIHALGLFVIAGLLGLLYSACRSSPRDDNENVEGPLIEDRAEP